MKFAEIYKLQDDGSQQIIAICELIDEKVVCRGNKNYVESFKRDGVVDRSKTPFKKFFPKDGLAFLEILKFLFKTAYLNASDVMEK